MKTFKTSFIWRVLIDQRGQALPLVAISIVALLGVSGLSIDLGHAYVVRSQLQSAANAAALAAVTDLYTTVNTTSAASSTLIADATAYSASSGGANKISGLTVTTTVTTPCISALMPTTTCSQSGNVPNAVRVKETASVPTFFMKVVGFSTLQVAATATAAPKGTNPWNIAIILDTTSSMVNQDGSCASKGSNTTSEQCAMNGIMTLLTKIKPCITGTSCTPDSANTWVRVSLFAFPNVSTATVANDYTCGSQPTGRPYTLATNILSSDGTATGTALTAGYTPIKYTTKTGGKGTVKVETSTYQITPANVGNADANGFLSDFYPGTTTQQLNPNSILVKAIGNSPVSGSSLTTGCVKPILGSTWPYGQETYFASAIYAAQAALQAEKAAVDPLLIASGVTSKNAIIFVSDGQANTYSSASFPPATSYAYSTGGVGGLNVTGSGSSSTNLTGGASGIYADFNNPCQQAIVAAQYAKNAGTRVFGVAYGAESGRCPNENKVVLTATQKAALNQSIGSTYDVTPCATVENIADSWGDFYADSTSYGCNVKATNAPMSALATIFQAIAAKLGPGGYLIPNSLT